MGGLVRLVATLALVACGGDKNPAIDAAVTPDVDAVVDALTPDGNPLTPETLAGTGLCTNAACTTFAADVLEYEPRFQLWSDTASKRRWISLPAGTTIDTTDMDYWKFPVGTKLWKEFTRDGVRVETRYIVKLLADDDAVGAWFYTTYQWNAAQNATTEVDIAGVMNANGTNHDIPQRTDCRECHEALVPSRVLGVGAISLDYTPANSALLDLEDLITTGKLSAPPTAGTAGARFPLPGTDVDRTALGYLHANCGHCHNPTSTNFGTTPVDYRLRVGTLATVAGTPAYASSVNVNGSPVTENGTTYTKIVIPGQPQNSIMMIRFLSSLAVRKMPQRGSEMADPDGQAALTAWINAL
ncbi:MAG: hypothetical protein H0T89_31760 [Deltaproteobacteria bacterium]|nr:hypothetical protein [Deltaproteobacteria bacterium]MDQ3298649.1 hypothetical protein [Myxococcota bacterium]